MFYTSKQLQEELEISETSVRNYSNAAKCKVVLGGKRGTLRLWDEEGRKKIIELCKLNRRYIEAKKPKPAPKKIIYELTPERLARRERWKKELVPAYFATAEEIDELFNNCESLNWWPEPLIIDRDDEETENGVE